METVMKILKWTTKLTSIAILGLVLFIVGAHIVEGGDPNGPSLSTEEILMSIIMGALFLGALIGLIKELIGGMLSIISFFAFAYLNGSLMQGFVFYTFLIIGFSNLVLYWYYRRER